MSVLIKGAKPPSGCRWCYFNEDSKCALIVGCDFDDTNGTQRRKDCPLVELPDHGDLIDRSRLIGGFADWYIQESPMYLGDSKVVAETIGDAMKAIEAAPVVIPAERSEDGET